MTLTAIYLRNVPTVRAKRLILSVDAHRAARYAVEAAQRGHPLREVRWTEAALKATRALFLIKEPPL